MKRNRTSLPPHALAGGLVLAVAAGGAAAQQIQPVGPGSIQFRTDTGIDFRVGLTLDYQPTFTSNLDFNDDTNFRTITEFGAIGEDQEGFIGFENRLFFSAAKDRVSLYTAIELDGTLDERSIDANNPNIERINLSVLMPEVHSTFTVGADIYVLDGIGGHVYIDDDPGIWVKGGKGAVSWQAAYHKRIEFGGAAGDSANRFAALAGVDDDRSDDTDFFSGKLGFDIEHGKGRLRLEPFGLYQRRDTPNSGTGLTRLNLVGPGGADRAGADPLQGGIAGIVPRQQSWFLGIGATGSYGILRPSAQFTYSGGEISGLRDGDNVPFGFDEFDISSWAGFFRLDLDLSHQRWWPLGAVMPFVQWESLSGDDDPFDDDLEGFVSPSSPSGLRRGDLPLLRRTVLGLGSPVLGDGTADFGFAVDGRGIGPTIGNILEGSTFGGTSLFNNRFGKGDNPGFHKVSFGIGGDMNRRWSLYAQANYVRFAETAPIEAEFSSFGIGSVDEDIGWGLDLMAVYKLQRQMQVRPFFSLLVPGDGSEQLAGDDETAFIGGVSFFGSF